MPNAGMTNRAVSLANNIVNYERDIFFFTFLNKRSDIDARIRIFEYMPLNLSLRTFWLLSENYGLRELVFSRMVSKELQKIHPDIVCVDHPPMDLYAIKAKKNIGFKLVYTYHSVVDPMLYSGRFRERMDALQKRAHRVAAEADLVIAVSNFVKRQLDEIGIDSTLVYNGVDTELFKPQIAHSPQFKTGVPTILYVGRLMKFKGVDLLIKAFRKIKKEMPEARLYIVGSKNEIESINYWNEIQTLCKGYEKSIFFLGNVCNEVLSVLYSVSDLFVCASLYEGFGMPFLEAESCGVPCVGFNTSAIPEVVFSGTTGILVEKGNVEKLAEAIINLLRDFEARKAMSSRARKFAEGFDWRIISLQFYEKLAAL
ncbi:MAG: glycosyltransferase family 4 protein [Candidatus Bathyarchaeia archaeon]